jgi:hypothetical protein
MYGCLKVYFIINHACKNEGEAEETEGEVIGIESQEGQGSPYTFMLTRKG